MIPLVDFEAQRVCMWTALALSAQAGLDVSAGTRLGAALWDAWQSEPVPAASWPALVAAELVAKAPKGRR